MHRLTPFFTLYLIACATPQLDTASSSSSTGSTVLATRIKELNLKSVEANACFTGQSSAPRGTIEVTANADGKVEARTIDWQGSPAVATCTIAAAQKLQLTPLSGPPIRTFWQFLPPDAPNLTPADATSLPNDEIATVQGRLEPQVGACAQRHLPPDFSADIEISFALFPGGKVVAANVANSTAKDGPFETCVQQVIANYIFPDPHANSPLPLSLKFHVGRSDSL